MSGSRTVRSCFASARHARRTGFAASLPDEVGTTRTRSRRFGGSAMSGRSERLPEKRGSLETLLTRHRRIAVDSNVLIYLLEGSGPRADIAADLVDAIAGDIVEGVLASIAIAEILFHPASANDAIVFEATAATIRDLGFRVIALDAAVAEDVAWIRGRSGIAMPDAIHLACARSAEATLIVTNDRRLPTLPRLEVAILDDLIA